MYYRQYTWANLGVINITNNEIASLSKDEAIELNKRFVDQKYNFIKHIRDKKSWFFLKSTLTYLYTKEISDKDIKTISDRFIRLLNKI